MASIRLDMQVQFGVQHFQIGAILSITDLQAD
jgi:hypothetical protein